MSMKNIAKAVGFGLLAIYLANNVSAVGNIVYND
jgi:hypothetical protein